MNTKSVNYSFITETARIINAGVSKSIILYGNVQDFFFLPNEDGVGSYVPLVHLLTSRWQTKDLIQLVYELNGPIRFLNESDREKVKKEWVAWKSSMNANKIIKNSESIAWEFEKNLQDAVGNPTVALEILRQLTLCSKSKSPNRNRLLSENLLILIEAADMLIPEGGEVARLSQVDRHRISIVQDWFSDPGFMNGNDSVVLITESRSLINHM